jgi:hypothetical protein
MRFCTRSRHGKQVLFSDYVIKLNFRKFLVSFHVIGEGVSLELLTELITTYKIPVLEALFTILTQNFLQANKRVLLLERDLSQPDRFVGEFLQPGGILKLSQLGLQHCIEDIDAQPVQ